MANVKINAVGDQCPVPVVSISSTFKLAAHMAGASALLKRYGLLRCLSRSIISFFAQV